MFEFASLDFPVFMGSLTKFQKVVHTSSPVRMVGDVHIITPVTVDDSKFEYVSDTSYVTLKIYGNGLHLVVMHIGETVVDNVYIDFSEVKDAVLRYS